MCYAFIGVIPMPDIGRIQDLRDTNAVSRLCHAAEEFECRCAREEIHAELLEAEGDVSRGDLIGADDVFSAMRAKYGY